MYSTGRSLAIITVGIILGMVIAWQFVQPVRLKVSERFVERGDRYLKSQDFDLAQDEYVKALDYNRDNSAAQSHLALARMGATEPLALRSFYLSVGDTARVAEIDAATAKFSDPKKAFDKGHMLYARLDYALARYPFERAVELDPEYSEAWNYLGLTYSQLAPLNRIYADRSKEVFVKRDSLTPNYLKP